jgi:predicted RND superfamily exporter protein
MKRLSVSELVERLVDVQVRRPWLPLGIVGAITVTFGLFASKLELRTRYEALLPDGQPSVQELRRVEAHTSLAQTVLILLEGPNRGALRGMGDALIPGLSGLGPDIVSSIEDGPHETQRFLAPRAGLFVERAALEKLASDVDARWDYEIAKETNTLLDEDHPPPPLTATELKRRLEPDGERGADNRFPDGYYERTDGTALVVVMRSPIAGGDLARIGAAMVRIRAEVETVKRSRREFENLRVSYAGDMPTGLSEYGVVRDDLIGVGLTGIALVLGAVLLYFMRPQALLVMAISILAGLVWTFGLTQIVIGHLNIATAFLISIVAGNGINVGILYQSRYFEQRRAGASPEDAVRTAVRTTWLPTVVAALASAASYGSLLVTNFRAFRDFGFIAGSGMLLCWAVQTLAVLPLLILFDRRPIERAPWADRFGMAYGKVFAWIVPKAPRALFAAGVAVAIAGSILVVRYATSDPMEYDMRKVQNDRGAASDLQRAWSTCNDVLGASQGGMVVLADTALEARQLHDELSARWNDAPVGAKPFAAVRSLWSFVPKEQDQKLPTLVALARRLEKAHDRRFVSEADWKELRPFLPTADLTPFGIEDLPEETARPFTDKGGTRGTLVFVEGEPTTSEDLHYLLRYADSFRETRLPSGKVVRGSGHAVIFADMLNAVVSDIPKAVSLSLLLTLVTVLITFRRASRALSVLFALMVGSAGVGAFLYLAKVKLNFLNFAALPITFGIGVDYAVNMAQRYYADGRRNVAAALRTSGGAVVLCSLTTILGYMALLGSHNQAIRSLGTIGVVGEISCLLAAVLVMPAMWLALRSLGFRQSRVFPTTHGDPRQRHAS